MKFLEKPLQEFLKRHVELVTELRRINDNLKALTEAVREKEL